MFREDEENKYYDGNDLLESQKKILFQKFTEAIKTQQWEIAYVLSYIENNHTQYTRVQKTLEWLQRHKEDPYKIEVAKHQCIMIDTIQHDLLLQLQPLFHELFDQVADKLPPGIWYNEALRDEIWFTLLFGERDLTWPMEWARDQYRATARSSTRQSKYDKKMLKLAEKRKQAKEKVWLPKDHQLLNEETYPKLKKTIWTHLDKVVTTYQQKFLKDIYNSDEICGLIDYYFLFIFIQMLVQSKIVFDTKKPQSNPFIKQVLDDCLLYLQEKYKVSLTISWEDIKKKLFSTIDESTRPLELLYKNCMEEDLLVWEEYLNANFFRANDTSVDTIRRQIMGDRNKNVQKMKNSWEALNPLYHIAVEKKEKIQNTIKLLEQHQSENNMIGELLKQLKENLEKAEEDRKNNVVFEEDTQTPKDPESITKLQNQHLKFHKVPVQYRKIFGLVINRLNNFYQIKNILAKKANKNNDAAFDQLLRSEQKLENILYHINSLVTDKDIANIFDKKWNQKAQDKTQRIQSFCLNTQKTSPISKKKRIESTPGQGMLDF